VALSAARARLWPGFGFVAAFAAGLAAGLATLAFGAGETSAADVLLAVVLLSGLATVAAVTVPRRVVESAAFIAGYGLGLDSPPDAILLRDAIVSLVGTWCAGVMLLGAALWRRRRWRDWGTELRCGLPVPGSQRRRFWCGAAVGSLEAEINV
jgi:hypothetical protein